MTRTTKIPCLLRTSLGAALTMGMLAAQGFPGASWPQASAESQGLDGTVLAQRFGALPWPANSGPVIVIANGQEVFRIGDVTRSEQLFSCSKFVTAMVCAKLLADGRIPSLDAPVPSTFHAGAWSGYPGDASYRQFLTMTSDYGLSPYQPAGGQYAYNNHAVDFVGESMSRQFFGIGPDRMHDVVQQALTTVTGRQDAIGFSGQWGGWFGGLEMSARDLARLGYLALRGGVWNGQRVLAQEFVDGLFRSQIPASAQRYPGTSPTQSDPFNQQSVTDILGGSWSFGLWRVGAADATGTWSHAAAEGYRGKRLILCPRGSLPNPSLEVVLVCLPRLPNEGPSSQDYVDILADAARALLPAIPDDARCIAATFEDGTLDPMTPKFGPQAVVNGRWQTSGSARALVHDHRYDGCDALLSIAPGMPVGSNVGFILRAAQQSDDAWLSTGPQTFVRLLHESTGTFRVEVYHHRNGQLVSHRGPTLTAARPDREIEMLVVARGDTVWCNVNGEDALGASGVRGVPAPNGGGFVSLRANAGPGVLDVSHVLLRPAGGPHAHIWIDALGDHEIVLFEPHFAPQFDPTSFAVLIEDVILDVSWVSILQPWVWPTVPGLGQHHLVLSSRGAALPLPTGTRLAITYRGQVEGNLLP